MEVLRSPSREDPIIRPTLRSAPHGAFAGASTSPARAFRAAGDAHPWQCRGRALPSAWMASVRGAEDGAEVRVANVTK